MPVQRYSLRSCEFRDLISRNSITNNLFSQCTILTSLLLGSLKSKHKMDLLMEEKRMMVSRELNLGNVLQHDFLSLWISIVRLPNFFTHILSMHTHINTIIPLAVNLSLPSPLELWGYLLFIAVCLHITNPFSPTY